MPPVTPAPSTIPPAIIPTGPPKSIRATPPAAIATLPVPVIASPLLFCFLHFLSINFYSSGL